METHHKIAVDDEAERNNGLNIPGFFHRLETLIQQDIPENEEPACWPLLPEFRELQAENKKLLNQLQYRILECARCNNYMIDLSKKLYFINSSLPIEKNNCRVYIENCICQLKQYLNQNIWNEFKLRFAEIHTDFYDRLVYQYPTLTVNDLRLCAFIKLKMSSKEIATVLCRPVNTIKIARKRLRKKLHMDNSSGTIISFLASY
jgi:DNA-binding CsgD family transcriptional regulator